MNYVRIGKRTLNLDSVSYTEVQVWQDEMTVKVYFGGSANNTPLVFNRERCQGTVEIFGVCRRETYRINFPTRFPIPHPLVA